jgi:hypothetical protein
MQNHNSSTTLCPPPTEATVLRSASRNPSTQRALQLQMENNPYPSEHVIFCQPLPANPRPHSLPARHISSYGDTVSSLSSASTPTSTSVSHNRSFSSTDTQISQDDSNRPSSEIPQWASEAVWSVEGDSTPRIPRYVYEHALCEQMNETTALAMYTNVIENCPSRLTSPQSQPSVYPSHHPVYPSSVYDERASSPSTRHRAMQYEQNRYRRDREWEALFSAPLLDQEMQSHLTEMLEKQQEADSISIRNPMFPQFRLPSPQNGIFRSYSHSAVIPPPHSPFPHHVNDPRSRSYN